MLIAGRGRAWIARLNSSGDGELFRVFLGKDPRDAVNAIAENTDGTIYAVGSLRVKGAEVGFWASLDATGKRTRLEPLDSPAYAVAIDSSGVPKGLRPTKCAERPLADARGSVTADCHQPNRDLEGVPMGLWPTKGDEGPLADACGSAWDAHCKQSRDRKGALEVWTFNGAASEAVYVAGDSYVMRLDGWTIAPPGPVRALAVNGAGILYAAGSKPAGIGAGSDAYIAKLNATHDQWNWTLPIGGSGGSDEIRALAIAADGAIYATGVTDSVDFPVKSAYQSRLNGPRDAFLVKVLPDGDGPVWSTYIGGRGADSASALTFDRAGNLLVAGSTDSSDFPGGDRWNGAQDGFFARFDTAGRFLEGAYIGSAGLEEINSIAVDRTGAAYVAGSTNLGMEEVLLAAIPQATGPRTGSTASSVTLAVSPTPVSRFGSAVTLTATVSPASATGKVTFYDGTLILGTSALAGGSAAMTTTMLQTGARSLHSYYGGDTIYAPSKSASTSLSVNAVASIGLVNSIGSPLSPGTDPRTVGAGDFNGDGKTDLAIVNMNSNVVAIFLGDGAGGFAAAPAISFPAGTYPSMIKVADVNGDGMQDLLIGSGSQNTISVLFGNGSGGFAIAAGNPFTVANGINDFSFGDFNNDGNVDIVVASISRTVSVLLGDGSGMFTPASGSPIFIGSTTFAVAVSDVNRDGNADIAVTNTSSNSVVILSGNGSGGFQPANGSPFATGGTEPRSIAIADLNGDGKPDIVTANNNSASVSILIGDGNGAFTSASGSPITVGLSPFSIVIGDINGDGKPDVAVANGASSTLTILLGNGTGSFTPMKGSPFTMTGLYPNSIALADFNGDGRTDIIVVNAGGSKNATILFGTSAALTIALAAAPAPSSALGQTVTLTAKVPAPLASGQVTFYDGSTVLGTSTLSSQTAVLNTTALPSGTRYLRAYYSGDATFYPATSSTIAQTVTVVPSGTFSGIGGPNPGAGTQPYAVATGDFDRDGRQDLAVVLSGTGVVSIWLSNGSGGFTPSAGGPVFTGTTPVSVAVGDVNGDGILDLAVANSGSNNIVVFLGNAVGGFSTPVGGVLATGAAPRSIVLGDFNGDGKVDIAVANSGTNNVTVLLGNGSGGFSAAPGSPFPAGSAPWALVTGDFNSDGLADLAIANSGSNNVTILLATGGGAFAAAAGSPIASGANPQALVAGDFNGDGKSDLVVANRDGGTVSVLLGTGGGAFAPAAGSPFAAGSGPSALAVLDFNADGKQDLAVANYDTSSVGILAGNGSGGFAAIGSSTLVGAYPLSIAAADFNGDSRADLAVAGPGANYVSLLLGAASIGSSTTVSVSPAGSAILGQPVTITATVSPSSATGSVAFYDGSAMLGVSVLSAGKATFPTRLLPSGVRSLRAYYGGDGNLISSGSSSVALTVNAIPSETLNWPAAGAVQLASSPLTMLLGDFNGDGKADMAVVTQSATGLSIFLGDGSGGFTAGPGSPMATGNSGTPFAVVTTDFNGDGKADLAFLQRSGVFAYPTVAIMLGNGSGGFTLSTPISLPAGWIPGPFLAGDFNGDGRGDLAIATGTGNIAIMLSDGIGGFHPSSGSPVAAGVFSIMTTADFNGDGIADLAVAAGGPNGVVVFLGNGAGGFTPVAASPIVVGTSPNSMFAADFNGDGRIDLAIANGGSNDVTVLLGNGSGGFTAASGSPFAAGTGPAAITGADFNGDGKLDLAVTNSSIGNVVLLIGNGSGGFTEGLRSPRAQGGLPSSMVAADFNGDGRADLATTVSYGGSYIQILYGVTASSVAVTASPQASAVLNQPVTITAAVTPASATGKIVLYDGGDVLGQGSLSGGAFSITTRWLTSGPHYLWAAYSGDLKNAGSVSSRYTESIVTYPSNAFAGAPGSPFAVGPKPYFVAMGDFNGDGRQDMAVVNYGGGSVSILLGNGSGGFVNAAGSPVATGGVGPVYLAIGDLNGDGKLDIVVTNFDSDNLSILLGDGTGGFTKSPYSPISRLSGPTSVAIGDFNADGKPDLAVVYGTGDLEVLVADGTGRFDRSWTYEVGYAAVGVVAGDFNGDGKLDLAAISSYNDTVTVLIGDGAGKFTAAAGSPYTVGVSPTALLIADFNLDGKPDLAVLNYDGFSVNILLGTGTGSFTKPAGSLNYAGAYPTFLATGDFNGDGKPDLVITNAGTDTLLVLFGNGAGGIMSGSYLALPSVTSPAGVAVGDFNGDARLDFAVADYIGNSVTVLLGSSTGFSGSIAAVGGGVQSTLVNTAFPTTLQAKVTDGSGSAVSGITVTFLAPGSGASATFAPGNSAVTNASGVASVSATANGVAGGYVVTASVLGLPATASFTLTNTADGLSISGQVTGAAGVTVTLSGSQNSGSLTNGSGNYGLTGLTAGGTYTVTPSLAGFSFTPPSTTFGNLQANQSANFVAHAMGPSKVAAFNAGFWVQDLNGNFAWDGTTVDRVTYFSFGQTGEIPVYGDWNGDGKQKIGTYSNGYWVIDYNGNGQWDGPGVDKVAYFGGPGWTPVVGDWNGDGRAKIGAFKDGTWLLDYDGNFAWNLPADKSLFWGGAGETPVVGDWNNTGWTKIGTHKAGVWMIDFNGNFAWDGVAVDKVVFFGGAGYTPVVGDWNGSGSTKIGASFNGFWVLDYNGNFAWDGLAVDKTAFFGGAGWTPMVGDWNGDGKTKIAAYLDGNWVLDMNGNYAWDQPPDKFINFGGVGQIPVVGKW